jgi:hypothetical protein
MLRKKCLQTLQDKLGATGQPNAKGGPDTDQKPSSAGVETQDNGAKIPNFHLEIITKSAPHWEKGGQIFHSHQRGVLQMWSNGR